MAPRRTSRTRAANKPIVRPGAPAKTATKATTTGEIPFDTYTLDRLKKILSKAEAPEFATNKKFVEGDHWQDNEGWVGPRPEDGSEEYEFVLGEIERSFVSKNVTKEMVERHANGVLGRSPVWQIVSLTPAAADDKEVGAEADTTIAELELALTGWWNRRKVHERLKEAVAAMLWGKRAPFRLFVPPDKIVSSASGTTGVPQAETLDQALDYVFPMVAGADEAVMFTEPATQRQLGMYITKPPDPETGEDGNVEVAELTYQAAEVDALQQPLTILRIMKGSEDTQTVLELGGRLTMFEITRPLLITDQVQQQQRALNLAYSMLPRNVVTGGFLERVLLNAQLPGEWEKDKDGNNVRFVPSRYVTGAGTTNALVGIEDEDPDGKVKRATPSVVWRDPTPVKPGIEAAQALYLAMLEEGKQAHIILSGEALVSGVSREQARSDYDLSLNDSKAPTEMLGEWCLITALALAEFFMGQPGLYTSKYRAVFQCHTFTGPVTWEERKQNDASIGKTLSQQRAMELNGVVDVDAILSQMAGEALTRASLLDVQGKAMKSLTDAGVPAELAAELLGFDAKVVAAIKLLATQALEMEKASQDAADEEAEAPTPPTE